MKKVCKYLSYTAMAAVTLAMMAATVLEKLRGSDFALEHIYHSPWFIALLGLGAAAGILFLLSRETARKPFTLGLHLGFVLVLCGALVTHLGGESGMLHLRQGEEASAYESDNGAEQPLDFGLRLEQFAIDYYPDSRRPMDYRSELTILPEGQRVTISMNHILKWKGYRFYQADYDQDLEGSILAVSHDPWGVGITYAGYLLILLCMIGFFFQRGTAFRALCSRAELSRTMKTILSVFGAVLLFGCFWMIGRKLLLEPLLPVLRSPLLWIHVSGMIISYSIFALVAVMGIVALFSRSVRERKRLQYISQIALYPAVFLLTFGTFIGAVWANISWGNYWGWDPKETWALVTLLIYSFALHGNSIKAFRNPVSFHVFAILAFLSVLVTYFGVNFLLGGIHAYA